MDDATADDGSTDDTRGDPVYWSAVGVFGLAALVGGAADLSASGPALSTVATVVSGVLLLVVSGWTFARSEPPSGPDSTLFRALVVGGAAFYAVFTIVRLL